MSDGKAHTLPGDEKTVLIVDDDAAVGTTLQRILQDEYRVDVLNDGREAVARLTGTHEYQAILCDLMMPALTGDAVYAEVIAARPELEPRFLFMTGGAFTGPGRRFLERMASRVLLEPVPGTTLMRPAAVSRSFSGRVTSRDISAVSRCNGALI